MFTKYLYLPRIWARPSRSGTQLFGPLLPLHCKCSPLMYSATPPPVSAKITTQNKPLHSKGGPSLMYGAQKTNKNLSRQGSGRSPLGGVAEALRITLLLREWPCHSFSSTGPLQSLCMCIGILQPQQQILGAEVCISLPLHVKKHDDQGPTSTASVIGGTDLLPQFQLKILEKPPHTPQDDYSEQQPKVKITSIW